MLLTMPSSAWCEAVCVIYTHKRLHLDGAAFTFVNVRTQNHKPMGGQTISRTARELSMVQKDEG